MPTGPAGTDAADPSAQEQDRDRDRTRRTWAVAAWGGAAAAVVALLTGILGGSGRVGAAVFLLVAALGCAAGALHGAVTLIVDELRDRRVGRGRPIAVVSLFVSAAVLMAMVAGLGG